MRPSGSGIFGIISAAAALALSAGALSADQPSAFRSVAEEDLSPDCSGWQARFPNSSVTDNADGTCSVAFTAATFTLQAASGANFEWTAANNSLFLANTTANTQLARVDSAGNLFIVGLNCSTFANEGAITAGTDGRLYCSDDNGGSGSSGTVTSITQGTGMSFSVTPITATGTINLATPVAVANGGTGLASGTSGGVLGYTGTGTLASSSALTANALVLGGGAGATPTSLAAATNGQLPIGSTGASPVLATVTGVASETDVTNGAGAITIGIVDPLAVSKGGTGAVTFASNGVLYGNAGSTLSVTAQGGANTVLTANAGAPIFSNTPTVGSLTLSASVPQLNLNPTSGNQFELTASGSSFYLTETTTPRFLLVANPSGKFVFPQYLSCNLKTDAFGNVYCGNPNNQSYVVSSGCDATYTTTFTDTPGGYCTTVLAFSEMNQWQQAGTWSRLFVAVGQAPGAGKTWTCSFCVNFWQGGFVCPLNCAISGASALSCSNTAQNVQSNIGDRVGLRCVSSSVNNAINNNVWNATFTPAN